MKASKLLKKLVTTLAVAGLITPAVVVAETYPDSENVRVRVSFADLNLESAEGVRVLYQRLKLASKEICGITSSNSILARSSLQGASKRCYRQTLSRSVKKTKNADLARLHAGQNI
jgi:UrcA family protein